MNRTQLARRERDAKACPPLFDDVPAKDLPPLPTRRQGMERMQGRTLAEEMDAFRTRAERKKAEREAAAKAAGKGAKP